MYIRKSTKSDYPEILKIYAQARVFMAEHGNPNQWGTNKPSEEQILLDIKDDCSYVCEENGEILAVFFYKIGDDPTYAQIYEGSWPEAGYSSAYQKDTSAVAPHSQSYTDLFDKQPLTDVSGKQTHTISSSRNTYPYGVVHRIASSGKRKGSASFCLNWALEQCGCLRIDTHHDNIVMQNLLKKNGFQYCGIIYLEDGSPRLAYQKNL